MAYSQDLAKGTIVPIILALLRERAMYGYEIVKVVNARTNGRFEWKEGTLYPTLHRLEADGLVKAVWRDAPPADAGHDGGRDGDDEGPTGRRRRYYRVTRRGAAELERRTREWREFSSAVDAFLPAV